MKTPIRRHGYGLYLLPLFLAFVASSCNSSKNLNYFQDLPEGQTVNLPAMRQEERQFQKGDRIQIVFGARDKDAAAIFNTYGGVTSSGSSLPGGQAAPAGSAAELMGYLIDTKGELEFPVLGIIKVEGMTTDQLKDTLLGRVSPYLKDPLVTVRFINFKFTVLGEVARPGTYDLPLQRTTILDALGAAGDLMHTAQRFDISIYRDYNGKRSIQKIDLRKQDVLTNPQAFQIRHNDVIYVKIRKGRIFTEEATLWTTLATLSISIVSLIVAMSN